MAKKIFFILLVIVTTGLACRGRAYSYEGLFATLEAFKKDDRILILAPHPDDETIGCAGVIQAALKAGASVRIAYLTNGDHNQVAFVVYEKRLVVRKGAFLHMGEVRRKEAIAAMQLFGLSEKNLTFMGYPDFGTFTIFTRCWLGEQAFSNLFTCTSSVPYETNLSFGAPYKGESILIDLKTVLLDYRPTKIFTSHPADVNVDHKALYLFLEVALADLRKHIPQPNVYPYLIHCVGWPLPRHYHPHLGLERPDRFSRSPIHWRRFFLDRYELDKKYQAILCYKSQTASSAFYLLSFARRNELFGNYPDIKLKMQHSAEISVNPLAAYIRIFKSIGAENLDRYDIVDSATSVSYELKDGSFYIRINKTEKLKERFGSLIYLFGYSYKRPFAEMPKIRVVTLSDKIKIFDKNSVIKPKDVGLQLEPGKLLLKIPLSVLGNPDFILVSVKAYGRTTPVDAVAFRKIVIREQK